MAIPSYDFLEKPLVDDFFDYDYDLSIYVPKVEGIKANAFVDLTKRWGSRDNAQAYLYLLAQVVNEVILSYKNQKYRLEMKYYLSHSIEARIELMNLFSDSVWYNRRDGGFMMAYNSGANLNQGKLIEFGIDKALSSVAKQMIENTIFGTRHLKYDINTKETFEDLDSLKTYLVENNYITQEESDEIENYTEIPSNPKYYITQKLDGGYVFTYLDTLKDAKANMRRYSGTGDW